jgi:hypothetical protein
MAAPDERSRAEELAALEAMTPWDRPAFRADLALLRDAVAAAARAYAADARVIARLAAQVPRCAGDERGGTPWTSFRQEIAVARSVSGQAAGTEIARAVRLTAVLPHTLDLLGAGRMTVPRARAFLDELDALDDELAGQLGADLADRVATLAPWRIRTEVRAAALALDPDVAALRKATATADRRTELQPLDDGQACVTITGPAVPLVRWHATLDARARALRAAGDPRNLDALRFDLATSTFPCVSHSPQDRGTVEAALRATTPGGSDGASAGVAAVRRGAASADCRTSRPVQAVILVPVETALRLSSEPAGSTGTAGWTPLPAGTCCPTPSCGSCAWTVAPAKRSTSRRETCGHRPTQEASDELWSTC